MTVYSYAQLESLWISAGGPKALAPVAAAIGEAESGGNSDALNPNDNGGTQSSFGIWQISNGTHTPPSPNWANPAENARLAVGKYRGAGNSFSPWGTFTSGAYKAFLNSKTTPDPNVPGSPTGVSAQVQAGANIDCLIGNPFSASIGLGPINIGTSIGPNCLFTWSMARAFVSAGLLAAGTVIGFAAIAVLAAAAGVKAIPVIAGSARSTGRAVQTLGGSSTGQKISSAGGSSQSSQRQTFRQMASDDGPEYTAADQRRLGEPKENPDLEVRGGAVRESAAGRQARVRRQNAAARARARRAANPPKRATGSEPF